MTDFTEEQLVNIIVRSIKKTSLRFAAAAKRNKAKRKSARKLYKRPSASRRSAAR